MLPVAVAISVVACASQAPQAPIQASVDIPVGWSRPDFRLGGPDTDLTQWWRQFHDVQLTELVEAALQASTDVVQARIAVRQADALHELAVAQSLPSVNYAAQAQRSQAGGGNASDAIQIGLSASWDADVFGGRHHAIDAAQAQQQSAQASQGNVELLVAGRLALDYISLRSAQLRLEIAGKNLASLLETLQITQWRNQAGLIGATEVEQAQVSVELTRSQVLPLELSIASLAHSLAVQTGRPPAALVGELQLTKPVPLAVWRVHIASPRDVLRLRPDVRAARYAVGKAEFDVAQAQARRYPVLSLGANAGIGAATVAALAQGSPGFAGMVLGLTGPLWDGGALQAQVRGQQTALALAQERYRATVLGALQGVEDAMAAMDSSAARSPQLQSAAQAAGRAATLARQRYASGLVDFQVVLETQRSQWTTEDALAQAHAMVSSDQVRLYQALGGGMSSLAGSTSLQNP